MPEKKEKMLDSNPDNHLQIKSIPTTSMYELNNKKINLTQKNEMNNNVGLMNDQTSTSSGEEEILNDLVIKMENYLKFNTDSIKLNRVEKLIENAVHWCLVNGFVIVPKERKLTDLMIVTYLPFTLFPTPFKRYDYEQVFNLQLDINQLVYKLANSPLILEKAFENLLTVDPFLQSLWKIYCKANKDGYNQKIFLSVLRVDYMSHENSERLNEYTMKQVEINTIAAGFGYVSTRAAQLHREILKWSNNKEIISKLPKNEPIVKIARGFVEAWRLYNVKNSIILFIVLDVESNIADQRHLEYEIAKQEANIEIQRCTLKDLYENGSLNENKVLFYDNKEVSVVYFRAGYAPDHYNSDKEWEALLRIEMSRAVKCPTVGTFLAGMKKIQEFISHEKNLLELCDYDQSKVNSFKAVFAQFFKLDSLSNVERVLNNPEKYVLKPQREGGGNNFYNQQIRELVKKIFGDNLTQSAIDANTEKDLYVVMELLCPLAIDNYIISPKSQKEMQQNSERVVLNKVAITNELGVYGTIVKNGEEMVLNEACGYCLRSKPASDNEGGVMCGSGSLNSIFFSD